MQNLTGYWLLGELQERITSFRDFWVQYNIYRGNFNKEPVMALGRGSAFNDRFGEIYVSGAKKGLHAARAQPFMGCNLCPPGFLGVLRRPLRVRAYSTACS